MDNNKPAGGLKEPPQGSDDTQQRSSSLSLSSSSQPPGIAVKDSHGLSNDYGPITELLTEFDGQVTEMVQRINTIVGSIPAHESLRHTFGALYDNEQRQESFKKSRKRFGHRDGDEKETINAAVNNTAEASVGMDDMALGDEADNPEDPLIFL